MSLPVVPKPFINQKANQTFAIKEKSYYGEPDISLFTIAKFSLNKAMLFYVVANVYTAYYLATLNDNSNQKFFVMGFLLFCTQVVYNWLDLNGPENLQKLFAFT